MYGVKLFDAKISVEKGLYFHTRTYYIYKRIISRK